jgi:predicted Na+-dependent transporter
VGFTEVKSKQDQTNGNVKSLQLWRAGLTGATGVLTLIMVPLLGWALYTLSSIDERINRGVQSALSAYEVTVQK